MLSHLISLFLLVARLGRVLGNDQAALLPHGPSHTHAAGRSVSVALFEQLEEFARIVDIAYCVSSTSWGISKPFSCPSRCSEFPSFELVTTWNTGPLLSDSCGYIALDHEKRRIILAFRGTYSIANTIVDLSTMPQKYVPYPGEDDGDDSATSEDVSKQIIDGLKGHKKRHVENISEPKCMNCTVHWGFQSSWVNTRKVILEEVQRQVSLHSDYEVNLVGHSLGGAVAALAALDFNARGWNPRVTTFGEPRVGNTGLVKYIDQRFNLTNLVPEDDTLIRYRRVTHVDDPVPLIPLTEWGYTMHAGEIYISKANLSPDVQDLQHCSGDMDQTCIASQDSTASQRDSTGRSDVHQAALQKRDLLASVKDELYEVKAEPWGIPSRYKLWQLFFAHRDYFWRIGLCLPGGDPFGGGGSSESSKEDL